MDNIMKVMHTTTKCSHVGTFMYVRKKYDNQLNDEHTVCPDVVFDTLTQNNKTIPHLWPRPDPPEHFSTNKQQSSAALSAEEQ